MENKLLKKLQIKPNFKVKVVNAPKDFKEIIGKTSTDVSFALDNQLGYEALFIFAITKADLMDALKNENIDVKTICWIFYPKAKSKLASDLNLMQSWGDLKVFNLTPCGSAAIDETWTALRIKPLSELKKSGLGNNEIAQGDYGKYIDVANKLINLPEDLQTELEEHSAAFEFYQALSYSNRKEYVLWVLSAKQEKTRLERIAKTIEKLTAGKKNPAEK